MSKKKAEDSNDLRAELLNKALYHYEKADKDGYLDDEDRCEALTRLTIASNLERLCDLLERDDVQAKFKAITELYKDKSDG